ncbi:hypothetical protein FNV43_RR18924 [Rhamnella rubrinervis]|uniref:MLO-like protein n=1 Tax=Rhamnella rubrinervis TaxID=2594499 RepID=A0A8K0E780_9ROSA|nr:hypothetical protein FNV43_RR18924 [Rhamnella rubrinervis]
MEDEELSYSLEYTPTWVVAGVCFVIVLISLCAERSLHRLGKVLQHKKQDALFEALQKLKEELMLLGFISLLLTVFQNLVRKICIPTDLVSHMLPCKRKTSEGNNHGHFSYNLANNHRRLLSEGSYAGHCVKKGKAPLLSLEALHHLHIFIFVLAVVHVIFCVTTMVLGGARIRQWKRWEDSIRRDISKKDPTTGEQSHAEHHEIFKQRAVGYWRKAAVISWMMSFFKQFYGSVTKSDYIALRHGFIKEHCPGTPGFNFHQYIVRTLEVDFKKIVGISWYLWLFVVFFLLLNLNGWHTYFWLAFLPLILLLLVGAKLEHIITRLAQEAAESKEDHEAQQVTGKKTSRESAKVKPSDEHFWFHKPGIVLFLIHFILFQNSFEIAFFFWIWSTYGFHSCIMEKVGYIVPRLFMGVIVQVLCSYSTLPLYALVTQMGSTFKDGIFRDPMKSRILEWREEAGSQPHVDKMEVELGPVQTAQQTKVATQGTTESTTEITCIEQPPFSSS